MRPARAAALALVVLGTGCGPRPASPSATVTTTRRVASAQELHLVRDAQGRVYDSSVENGATTQTRPVGMIHVPGGHLRVLDGSSLGGCPCVPEGETKAVELGDHDELQVDVVWEDAVFEGEPEESVLGVLVTVPGARPVAAWSAFEDAYSTDGGQGGITSQAVVDRANALGYDRWKEPAFDKGADVVALDLDGVAGDDSVLFANGFGDGAFPLSKGTDAAGAVVAVMVWDPRYPWRLAVPEGTPPADVTQREDELQACLDGKRDLEVYEGGVDCS